MDENLENEINFKKGVRKIQENEKYLVVEYFNNQLKPQILFLDKFDNFTPKNLYGEKIVFSLLGHHYKAEKDIFL